MVPSNVNQDKIDQIVLLSPAERSRSEDPLGDGPRSNALPCSAKSVQNVCEEMAPPIPPLPTNYQRSDGSRALFASKHTHLLIVFRLDESCSANESREQRKSRAHSKAVRQAELKR